MALVHWGIAIEKRLSHVQLPRGRCFLSIGESGTEAETPGWLFIKARPERERNKERRVEERRERVVNGIIHSKDVHSLPADGAAAAASSLDSPPVSSANSNREGSLVLIPLSLF